MDKGLGGLENWTIFMDVIYVSSQTPVAVQRNKLTFFSDANEKLRNHDAFNGNTTLALTVNPFSDVFRGYRRRALA